MFNVTFEPGYRNNWHIHHAKSGGGQILICVTGRGWYQEWGMDGGATASYYYGPLKPNTQLKEE